MKSFINNLAIKRHNKYYGLKLLTTLYVCFIDFRVFEIKSLSLADFFFILAALCLFKQFKSKHKTDDRILYSLYLYSFLWVMSYISPVFNSDNLYKYFSQNIFMIIGALYLPAISVYFYFITLIFQWVFVAKTILYAGLVNAVLGIILLIMHLSGIENVPICVGCSSAPYMKEIPRIMGFSTGSNLYAYSLFCALLVALPLYRKGLSKKLILVCSSMICVALLLTLAKMITIMMLAILIWFLSIASNHLIRSKSMLLITLVFGSMLYVVVTHFQVGTSNVEGVNECLYGEEFVPLTKYVYSNKKVCPTFFVQQKLFYWDKGIESLPWGLGYSYPVKNRIMVPHNTFLERFSIHGIPGLISLGAFIFFVGYLLRLVKGQKNDNNIYYCLLLFWLMNILISINSDILRYRELWVFLGCTMGVASKTFSKPLLKKS